MAAQDRSSRGRIPARRQKHWKVFLLFGGGVAGDIVGLPRSWLAILPGTTHTTLVHRAE